MHEKNKRVDVMIRNKALTFLLGRFANFAIIEGVKQI